MVRRFSLKPRRVVGSAGLLPEDQAALAEAQANRARQQQALGKQEVKPQGSQIDIIRAKLGDAAAAEAEAAAKATVERLNAPKPTVMPPEPTKAGEPIPGPSRQAGERALVDVRKDVLKPVLETLQAGADFFESHSGFASEAEINQFLSTGGRYKDPKKYAPKTAEELFSRLALVGTSGVKGAIKDLTFPISWGVSPPKTKAQQGIEFMAAVFVPSPADYAVVKTLSYLGRTVKGRILAKILVKGDAAEISENADEIIRYINQYDEIKTLNIKTVKKLQSIANDVDDLKRIYPEGELIDQTMRADDALTALSKGKNGWRKGLGVEELMDPDNARRGVLLASKAMRDVDDGVALLFDLDPDNPTAFLDLSPKDQVKVLKKVNELLRFWEGEGAGLYAAGGAYEPELIMLAKSIKNDPELIKDVILNTDKYGISPASLVMLLEGLNEDASGTNEVSALVENEIERLRESREIPGNIIETLDDVAEDIKKKEDEETRSVPVLETPQRLDEEQKPEEIPKQEQPQEPKEDQPQEQTPKQDQPQEQTPVEDIIQEEEEKKRGIFLSGKDRPQKLKKPKAPQGSPGKYRVEVDNPHKIRVFEAENFIDAGAKGDRILWKPQSHTMKVTPA